MNVRDGLERARAQAPRVEPDLGLLQRRRVRRARAGRIGTATLALVIGFAAIGGAWLAFRGEGAEQRPAAGSDIGPSAADLTLGDGQFYLMRVHATSDYPGSADTAHQEAVYETWWAADDSGRIHNLEGSYWNGHHDTTFVAGEFYSDSGPVSDLSTDPAQLEAQLRTRVDPGGVSPEPYAEWGGPIEWGLIRSIQELLLAPDVTPAVKATLVQVAANLDGVTVDDRAVDPQQRSALLLTSHTEDKTSEWWFDPSSLQLMSTRETGGDGSVTTNVIEAAGVAGSTGSDHLTREFITSPG
jgi:hypothetical protein